MCWKIVHRIVIIFLCSRLLVTFFFSLWSCIFQIFTWLSSSEKMAFLGNQVEFSKQHFIPLDWVVCYEFRNCVILFVVCVFFFVFGFCLFVCLFVVFSCCVSVKIEVLEIKLVSTHDDSVMPPASWIAICLVLWLLIFFLD